MNGKLIEGNDSAPDLIGPLKGKTVNDLVQAMNNGSIYVNVHTTQNPGGEIRGQIDPANMTCGKAVSAGPSSTPSTNQSPIMRPRNRGGATLEQKASPMGLTLSSPSVTRA